MKTKIDVMASYKKSIIDTLQIFEWIEDNLKEEIEAHHKDLGHKNFNNIFGRKEWEETDVDENSLDRDALAIRNFDRGCLAAYQDCLEMIQEYKDKYKEGI